MSQAVDQVLEALGYLRSAGWLDASRFGDVNGPRGSLRLAKNSMNVVGSFGTWQASVGTGAGQRFAPLLYVASATDANEARKLHCRVWSQGLVPLLIVVTPARIYVSEGFGFSHDNWYAHVADIETAALAQSGLDGDGLEPLQRLRAARLSSALAWRDFQLNSEERVDRRLLLTLKALSKRLAGQSNAPIEAVNALIGRFLYFYILSGRGFVTDEWLSKFESVGTFFERSTGLTTSKVWRIFDALDDMLNGTIFPVAKRERHVFRDADLQLLRDCIKLGDSLEADGIQQSFIDFDLSSLQTETLSAIYEQFLESEDSAGKRNNGVFYTPPFLVDFVLDRVEDETTLTVERRVLDCTAGSGVFLVGAYRRIIESALSGRDSSTMPAVELRGLLLSCIFGVEKNESAHAVAAFSLYLTMLDYVDVDDIKECLQGAASEKLFPPLGQRNLICRDVFAVKAPDLSVRKFDVVVGNPPWQHAGLVTSVFERLDGEFGDQVDSGEAAEHAMWWALNNFAEPGSGIVALVLPTKSLVGPSADRFPRAVAEKVEVAGVVNLSHLRYTLFSHARQAACMLMVRNRPPSPRSKPWIYSPSRAHLIGPVKGAPWLLTLDRSHVEHCRQRELARNLNGDSWFALLMLKSVDRYIKRYLTDSIAVGKAKTLKGLLSNVGADLRKGGSPIQTGLPANLLHGVDKHKDNDIRRALGVTVLTKDENLNVFLQRSLDGLESNFDKVKPDAAWLEKADKNFTRRFSGNCLLVPRSMVEISYAKWPVAFNSSVNAIFFSEDGDEKEDQARRRFLSALGLFLEGRVANYLFALFGKLWILDKTRLEKNDFLEVPVPFSAVNDPLVDAFLATKTDLDRTALVCERFGLNGLLLNAVQEYTTFRHHFEDGGVPTNSSDAPSEDEVKQYTAALAFALKPIDAGTPEIRIEQTGDRSAPIRVMVALSHAVRNQRGTRRYLTTTAVSEGASLEIEAAGRLTLVKPGERFRWTVESAFADGNRVIEELMDESRVF